jgi:hypothetical protein
VGKWGSGEVGRTKLPLASCLLPPASCLLSAVSYLPSSQWSLIFDKLGFGELARPIR